MRLLPTSGLAVLLAVGITACGGGEDSSETVTTSTGTGGPSKITKEEGPRGGTTIEFDEAALDQASVRTSIEEVMASGDPAKACGEYVTPEFVERAYGDREACVRAQGPGSSARAVAVKKIAIAGEEATAIAVPDGGPSDGDTITASLILTGQVWKVDKLESDAPVGP